MLELKLSISRKEFDAICNAQAILRTISEDIKEQLVNHGILTFDVFLARADSIILNLDRIIEEITIQ